MCCACSRRAGTGCGLFADARIRGNRGRRRCAGARPRRAAISRDQGIRQMEKSLRRWRVTCPDLRQVHNFVDWTTHLKTLSTWKEPGRVRYVGVTHHSESACPELERAIKTRDIDFLRVNYSIASTAAVVGMRVRLHELGAMHAQVHSFPPGGDLCNSGDCQPRKCARRLAGRPWTPAGCGIAHENGELPDRSVNGCREWRRIPR